MHDGGSSLGGEREEITYFNDPETGLRGITVLQDPQLGPTVGSLRSRVYECGERALADALRQARTTMAKTLIAGLPLSGGCTVLLDDGATAARLPALGRAVDALNGRYFLLPDLQGDGRLGDDGPAADGHWFGHSRQALNDAIDAAASGIRIGIEHAVRQRLARPGLVGVRIGIIGLGAVGFRLAAILREAGARLTVADRDPRRTERTVRELGIACVATEEMIHLDTDVLVPTASKDMIDDSILSHLRCSIVAAGVDDVLTSPALGQGLHDRRILYAPDSVINAGGLISLVQPLLRNRFSDVAIPGLDVIGCRLDDVVERARKDNRPTAVVADHMAEEELAARLGSGAVQAVAS